MKISNLAKINSLSRRYLYRTRPIIGIIRLPNGICAARKKVREQPKRSLKQRGLFLPHAELLSRRR
jgi:hypothetical protein